MGLMTSGGRVEAAYANELSVHFASQAGDVLLPVLADRPPVRLAIVDTAATRDVGAEDERGTSEHGFSLLNIVNGLLCDTAGGCVAKITSRLALGWLCFDPAQLDRSCRDAQNGGFYGLPGELARAIHLEVVDWRTDDPGMKLVMNLSLGWDPALGGLETPDSDIPAPAIAVRTALEHAVCEGALVIAAAGNRSGGPTLESGALLPAAWEERAGPSLARCQALGVTTQGQNFPLPNQTVYRPLVYAAGGVRADDSPLFNGREDSEPRLVAFGDHAKVPAAGADGSGWAGTLTGTSVSAAVVSASVAAAWYYNQNLKPFQVPTTAYLGGKVLAGRYAEVCLGGFPCQPVSRVSVCGAAVKAGAVLADPCPDPQPISSVDLTGIPFPISVDAASMTLTTGPLATCQMESLFYERTVPADPCPHWQYFPRGPDRRTESQPGPESICPVCTYEPELASPLTRIDGAFLGDVSGGVLKIEIDSAFEGEVSGGILKCGDQTFSLDLPLMRRLDTAEVKNLVCTDTPVQLSFTVDGDKSATSSVLVVEPPPIPIP
jgi:hypothetical protein